MYYVPFFVIVSLLSIGFFLAVLWMCWHDDCSILDFTHHPNRPSYISPSPLSQLQTWELKKYGRIGNAMPEFRYYWRPAPLKKEGCIHEKEIEKGWICTTMNNSPITQERCTKGSKCYLEE